MTQLTLFGDTETQRDMRPLPLIVADKWGFELAYIEREDGSYIYSARDWFLGMGGSKPRWSATVSSTWFRSTEPTTVETKRKNGRADTLHFCPDHGLYIITQEMRKMQRRPQLQEIRDYLASAGVKLDQYRLDPEQAIHDAMDTMQARGMDDGRRAARIEGIVSRKQFTDMLYRAVPGLNIGKATNSVYTGVFHRDAAQLRAEMGLPAKANVRDHMHRVGLHLVGAAESTIAELFKGRESIPVDTAMSAIYRIGGMFGQQADEIQHLLGVDVATGRPLLAGGVS